jgi:hypothetical protein
VLPLIRSLRARPVKSLLTIYPIITGWSSTAPGSRTGEKILSRPAPAAAEIAEPAAEREDAAGNGIAA